MSHPSDVPLSGSTHGRLAERRRDDAWLEDAWSRARVLPLAGSRVRVADGKVAWVDPGQAPPGRRILLGAEDAAHAEPRFAVIADAETAPGEGSEEWVPLRDALPSLAAEEASYVVHAVGLAEWHLVTNYCPRCAGELEPEQAGHVLRCVRCRRTQFPRVDPAVIMLVTDDRDRALLGRQSSWPERRWSTLAGFVEPGETPEQAVRREVWEESSVRVGPVEYAGAQPWPLPASLMLGFVGRLAEGAPDTIEVDGAEVAEARWFSREDLLAGARDGTVQIPSGISISRTLITGWYGGDLPGQWT